MFIFNIPPSKNLYIVGFSQQPPGIKLPLFGTNRQTLKPSRSRCKPKPEPKPKPIPDS